MAEMADGSGAPERSEESAEETPQSPDRTVVVQSTITVIKSSEAERMKSVENGEVVSSSEKSINVNGKDETVGEKLEPTDTMPEVMGERTETAVRREGEGAKPGVTEVPLSLNPKIKGDVQTVSKSATTSANGGDVQTVSKSATTSANGGDVQTVSKSATTSANGGDVQTVSKSATTSANGGDVQTVSKSATTSANGGDVQTVSKSATTSADGDDVQTVSKSATTSANVGVGYEDTKKKVRMIKLPEPLTEEEIDSAIKQYGSRLTKTNLQKCLDFYWSVDTERHGYFTMQEFTRVMRIKKRKLTDEEILDIFTDIDLNCDLVVDLGEYLLEISRKRWKDISKEDLKPVFDDMDKNHDGYICESDYEIWVEKHPTGMFITDPFNEALLHEIKLRPDKRVDLDRFYRTIKITSQR